MRWLIGIWYCRMRRTDIKILWPVCVKKTLSLDEAKAVFAMHAHHDPAWLILGDKEIYRVIDGLGI